MHGYRKEHDMDAKFEDTVKKDLGRHFKPELLVCAGNEVLPIAVIPTGIPELDDALGIGGIPQGRMTDIYGPESSGKTTLCLYIVAQAQQMGLLCVFVDMEHALDTTYATKCGVDLSRLYISRPDDGEKALDIAEAVIKAGAGLVVLDSMAALVPHAETEAQHGDNLGDLQERLIDQGMRKIIASGLLQQFNVALVVTNQIRVKHGVMFGNPESPTGGLAARFYASIRLDIRRVQSLKSAGEIIGARIRAVVKKNKLAAPHRDAEFDLLFPQAQEVDTVVGTNGRYHIAA
jgi:recombination protein RecA